MTAKSPVIVPSLLAADLSRLGESVAAVKAAGANWVSVDIMDGHFVPNLSFGPEHVRFAKAQGVMVDSHLMVENPQQAAPWFIKAGADIVTVHLEACKDAAKLLREIRRQGAKAGLAIKPQTPAAALIALLDEIDLALVMTVEPGFGGAHFLPEMLPKIREVRRAIDERHLDCWLQVDGGINAATALQVAEAGADSLVAGSAVFGASDIVAAYHLILESARKPFAGTQQVGNAAMRPGKS